jgi:hypothetical protein
MSKLVLATAVVLAAPLWGCGGGGNGSDGGAGGTGGASGLPCDVEAVVKARCQHCHGPTKRFGAPANMDLFTYTGTQAPAVSDPSIKVWQMMKKMVDQREMPLPTSPTGPLTDGERATLEGWWAAGAPMGTMACSAAGAPDGGSAAVPPGPPPGPQSLPCTPNYEFRAHAESGSTSDPFVVPQGNDTYRCFDFQVPFSPEEQAVAWAPIIDDERVIHHWILYGHTNTVAPPPGGLCGDGNRVFLMGWAPGGQNGMMPPDIGLELPNPGGWLTLEVHYNNKARYTDAADRSGVAVCTTTTPRPKEAGVITLGSVAINIPPGAEGHEVKSEITASLTRGLTEPLHVLWTSPHMHTNGTAFRTDIIRGTEVRNLVDLERWSFDNQRAYTRDPAVTTIEAGDALRTTCTYRNPGATPIRFGEKTENEMCFNFVVVYPINKVMTRQWVR